MGCIADFFIAPCIAQDALYNVLFYVDEFMLTYCGWKSLCADSEALNI